jgi:hypothetical protein
MIVRRLAARKLVKHGSTEEEPRRKRAARFVLIIFAAGTLAGLAAWLDLWPFGSIQTLLADVFGSSGPPQVSAQSIFPPVQPTHKTVDVYATPPPPRPRPRPTSSAAPAGPPHPQPSATPSPPDD